MHEKSDLPFGGDLIASAFSLEGVNAVVSGAGSVGKGVGIGRAIAILLAAAGAHVALFDVNGAAAEETLEAVRAVGGEGMVCIADASDDAAVAQQVRAYAGVHGDASVLINNVGIVGPRGNALDVDLASWDKGMAVNVRSAVIMSRHVLPGMIRQGGGSVVNIGSVAGMGGGYPSLFYPTSKAAILSLTQSMAAHHGRDGVRVNAVAPGQLYTPRIAIRNPSDELRARRAASSVLGIEGTGWDAAYAALYLASPAARWVTGVVLPVDAGVTGILPLDSPASERTINA